MNRVILILALLLAGCARKPVRIAAIDFAPVHARHADEAQHVAASTAKIKTTRTHLDIGRGSVGREKTGIGYVREGLAGLEPRIEKLAMAVSVELRPEVDAVKAQVIALTERTAELAQANSDAEKALEAANGTLLLAQADNEAATRAHGETAAELAKAKTYAAQAVELGNANADIADRAELGKAKAEKRAVIAWSLAGVAVLGCAVLSYLLLKP